MNLNTQTLHLFSYGQAYNIKHDIFSLKVDFKVHVMYILDPFKPCENVLFFVPRCLFDLRHIR